MSNNIEFPEDLKVVAVTKRHSILEIEALLKQYPNITRIGESRWQEAKDKLLQLPNDIETHFIGHLQSNKAADVVSAFDVIQSLDSIKLAKAINTAAEKLGKQQRVFLQVNISNDSAKHGFTANELPEALKQLQGMDHLVIEGLMTITAKQSDDETKRDFALMKQLQVELGLPDLSMGMSADWELAVEAGATMVRVGSGLFEGVDV